MTWEEAVKKHFDKAPLTFYALLENVEYFLEDETGVSDEKPEVAPPPRLKQPPRAQPFGVVKPTGPGMKENSTLEGAKRILKDMGYKTKLVRNQIKVLVPNNERSEVMQKLRNVFEQIGYKYDPTRGGTHGMLKKLSRKEGSAFIVVKPDSSQGRAAQKGMEYEESLAKLITDKYSQYGITVKTAGFGHGSDLEIEGPGGSMTIEAKTSSGADFGQFRLLYNTDTGRWEPSPTKAFMKNKALFDGLFKEYLAEYLDKFAEFPDLNDPRVKKRKEFVTGLNPHVETGEYKKMLQDSWFAGRADLIVPVDFESIAHYYADKGDRFIQIGGRGLYAFSAEDAAAFSVPMFGAKGKKASVRFRIKPEMGLNGHHSFTVAVKLTIAKSDKDLTNEEDLDEIAKILQAEMI